MHRTWSHNAECNKILDCSIVPDTSCGQPSRSTLKHERKICTGLYITIGKLTHIGSVALAVLPNIEDEHLDNVRLSTWSRGLTHESDEYGRVGGGTPRSHAAQYYPSATSIGEPHA